MKAIMVKYLHPSHTQGPRWTAWDLDGNRITVSASLELRIEDDQTRVVREFIRRKWRAEDVSTLPGLMHHAEISRAGVGGSSTVAYVFADRGNGVTTFSEEGGVTQAATAYANALANAHEHDSDIQFDPEGQRIVSFCGPMVETGGKIQPTLNQGAWVQAWLYVGWGDLEEEERRKIEEAMPEKPHYCRSCCRTEAACSADPCKAVRDERKAAMPKAVRKGKR